MRLISKKINYLIIPGLKHRSITRQVKSPQHAHYNEDMIIDAICTIYLNEEGYRKALSEGGFMCNRNGLLAAIRIKSRKKEYVHIRQSVCYFLKTLINDNSLKNIGKFLNGRDHSTVIHSITKYQEDCEGSKEFMRRHLKLCRQLDFLNQFESFLFNINLIKLDE